MLTTQWTVYIPVGPEPEEVSRLSDLVDSIITFEPCVHHLVLIDDSPLDRSLEKVVALASACEVISIPHPCHHLTPNYGGGLCASDIVAFAHIQSSARARIVVKLDTDALVIGPFIQRLDLIAREHPEVGMFGLLGHTCDRTRRSLDAFKTVELSFRQLLEATPEHDSDSPAHHGGIRPNSERRRHVSQARQHIHAAIESGFEGAHCQGGAYAVTKDLLDRMYTLGFLSDPMAWYDLGFGEDVMMGAHCAAAGLEVMDFSDLGQLFGVQARGLPHTPSLLLESGYSFVHSVKNDPRYTEGEIRNFFRRHRAKSR